MKDRFATLILALLVVGLIATRPPAAKKASAGNGDNALVSQSVDSAYAPDTNFQAFRAGVATIDTPTTTIVLATPAFQVQNRTTLYVGTRFAASGDSVSFRLAYVWRHPSATSDTDVTVRAFSWKVATWAPSWANTSYNVASNRIKGWSPIYTITAGTTQYEGAYYPAVTGDAFLDSERASTVRVVVTTAPSSTVDFAIGS